MTTNYTATVDITTPAVTLTDFTSVVPASLGVNVYGGATGADINTFDIGPTGDSNILLQTLAVGNHHIHDGVCHNSADGTVPPYGVHGIYDKAVNTLVETVEFYDHPNGQGYSPRYANRCKSCVFHDTPFLIGLFNYQGAALGAGGSLRIRDAIGYDLPSGGYVFYSDGIWRAADGTILGDSQISVELDHCTFDIRGVTNPFDFSACHNDVYLTNCAVISDSGLPLSSIITPPTDGSTVHLDGSIVLNSADAATYLGPAPTFTPIAVGGSPVIGGATASPPGCFAEWGNEGDVGATQTGSTPPGPPPLPGPALPALASLGVIGTGFADGSDVISIPIDVDVPRSDPAGGATIVIVVPFLTDGTVVDAVGDDAPTDPFYSTHLYTDGMNPPYVRRSGPALLGWNGLILNPLTAGVDTITLQLAGATTFGGAIALAYTGVQVNNQSNPTYQVADQPTLNWFDFLHIPSPFGLFGGNPFGSSGNTRYLQWTFDPVAILNPSSATYPNWSIHEGGLAVYIVLSSTFSTTAPGDFTPADGTWTEVGSLLDVATPPSAFYPAQSLTLWEKPVTTPELNDDLDGTFAAASTDFGANAFGVSLIAGLGPIWLEVPPTGGAPVFNNHIRLSE